MVWFLLNRQLEWKFQKLGTGWNPLPLLEEYRPKSSLQAKTEGWRGLAKKLLNGGLLEAILGGFPFTIFNGLYPGFQPLTKERSMRDLLQAGINFFNEGRYFEAHEAWEDMWRPAGGPLRLFYQGLVQAAVGLHHLGNGNLNGARAQLEKSLTKLEQYPQKFCRLDNGKLVHDLRSALDSLTPGPIRIERSDGENGI